MHFGAGWLGAGVPKSIRGAKGSFAWHWIVASGWEETSYMKQRS